MNYISFLFFEHPFLGVILIIASLIFVATLVTWRNEKTRSDKFKEWMEQNLSTTPDKTNAKGYIESSAYFLAEGRSFLDELRAQYLELKRRPARKGADEVRWISKEKRNAERALKNLQGELLHLSGLFPEIMEAREHYLSDDEFVYRLDEDETSDPITRLLEPAEYKKLSDSEKSDLALERYLSKSHSNLEIGRMYERYLGYQYEIDGWDVEFKGIVDGYDDLGRDLICRKDSIAEVVQAKNWSSFKSIRENVVFQLYASVVHFELDGRKPSDKTTNAVLAVTTELSETASEIARRLEIKVQKIPLAKDYPMIKCNINRGSNERIYHLPFNQQYDKIKIEPDRGERYVHSAKEAEEDGFRRAWRWRGQAET